MLAGKDVARQQKLVGKIAKGETKIKLAHKKCERGDQAQNLELVPLAQGTLAKPSLKSLFHNNYE